MKRLIFFTGVYDTLDLFIYELRREFDALGYDTMIFDVRDMPKGLRDLAVFAAEPVNAAITFNNLGFNMELHPGHNLWEELRIPCINILMDHPFCYKNALDNAPNNAVVLCTDRNHMRYLQRFYPEIPVIGYLPHAGKELPGIKRPISERSIDVLYAGNLSKSFAENIIPDLAKYKNFDVKELCRRAYEDLIVHPFKTTEQALEEMLALEGVLLSDGELKDVIADLHFVDLYVVSYYREKTVRAIAEWGIPIHIYGAGWENCSWINRPNVCYGGKIPAEEVVARMQDAKIVLSTMTWFKDGTHDRVFNGMLQGAVAVSDTSGYMKEEFRGFLNEEHMGEDDRELVLFELEELDKLPKQIQELLDNPERAQRIADRGYAKARKFHTWRARALELEQDMGWERVKENKKILVITHQLSRTGAPIVLLDMIRVYHRCGYQLEVITMMDGELRKELEELDIPIMVQEHFIAQIEEFLQYAGKFDLVIANTLVTFEAVQLLKYTEIPVLWWLHEGKQYFEYFQNVLPDFRNLSANVHVFSVGHYVQRVIKELYGVHTEILHFGVEDNIPTVVERQMEHGKVRFLTAGTYSKVKAQDILVGAIQRLPQDYLDRAEFYFCGNEQTYDKDIFLPVQHLSREYENVTLLHQLSRKETLEWMERCDCLIVPSRIDPIPTVAVEMMMKGNLCLCTDVCGIAHYIQDDVNGLIVPPEDVEMLEEKIKYIIDNNRRLDSLRKEGRKIYEKYFSMDVFEQRIKELAEYYMCRENEPGKDEEKDMGLKTATVIITAYNQKKMLLKCLEWLKEVLAIANIVIVDNGSTDGTSEVLADMGYDYIYFDEGAQGYGKVWNAAIDNFEMEDVVVFMEPGYLPGKECILQMIEVLEQEDCGMVGAASNGLHEFPYYPISNVQDLPAMENELLHGENIACKSLRISTGIWALSKRILSEAGVFDEKLSGSENVMADYKMRMVKKGYQPMACYRALAFCVPGEGTRLDYGNSLREYDRDILKEKWNMNYFNFIPSYNLIDRIETDREAPIRVLEVGCDLGMNLLEIKNRYPNSEVFGMEINPSAVGIAKHFAKVETGNIEDRQIPFEEKFDYIIFGDVLEHLRDPQGVVGFCKQVLTEQGCILTSIPNLMHISVMEQLLCGRFVYQDEGLLDRSHIHFFTCYEIYKMFLEEGYVLEMMDGTVVTLNDRQEELIRKLLEISEGVEEHMYRTYQYLVRARKA